MPSSIEYVLILEAKNIYANQYLNSLQKQSSEHSMNRSASMENLPSISEHQVPIFNKEIHLFIFTHTAIVSDFSHRNEINIKICNVDPYLKKRNVRLSNKHQIFHV